MSSTASNTRRREAYRQKAEARLAEQKAGIDKARAKVKGAAADVRIEADEQLTLLEQKYASAKRRLDDLKEAGEGAWEDLAKGLDDAWDDLSGSLKKVFARFR